MNPKGRKYLKVMNEHNDHIGDEDKVPCFLYAFLGSRVTCVWSVVDVDHRLMDLSGPYVAAVRGTTGVSLETAADLGFLELLHYLHRKTGP